MNDPERQAIKDRIAAAQARNAKKGDHYGAPRADGPAIEASRRAKAKAAANDTAGSVTDFVKDHPVAVIAGGVVLGVLISGLFKGSPTRKAGEAVGTKAAGLAAIGSEIAYHFGQQVLEAVQEASRAGADTLDDLGDSVSDTARGLRRDASYRAAKSSDAAKIATRDAGKTITRALRR